MKRSAAAFHEKKFCERAGHQQTRVRYRKFREKNFGGILKFAKFAKFFCRESFKLYCIQDHNIMTTPLPHVHAPLASAAYCKKYCTVY